MLTSKLPTYICASLWLFLRQAPSSIEEILPQQLWIASRVLEQSTANELPANAPSMLMTVSKGTGDKVIFNRMSNVSEY